MQQSRKPFFPVTHALIGDWFTIAFYIFLFLFGFVLISMGDRYWALVDQIKRKALIIGVIGFSLLVIRWNFIEDSTLVHFIEAAVKVVNLWDPEVHGVDVLQPLGAGKWAEILDIENFAGCLAYRRLSRRLLAFRGSADRLRRRRDRYGLGGHGR